MAEVRKKQTVKKYNIDEMIEEQDKKKKKKEVKKKETKKDKKIAAEQIMKLVKFIKNHEDSDLYHFINTHTYFISKRTIWNTRALLESKAKLAFDKWEDLDALEKRLDEGQRLFVIHQNQGGDGWDSDAVYALGGWGAKFGDKASVEVLYSECC